MEEQNNGRLGYIRKTAGKALNTYVTNLSFLLLKELISLPSNSLIICAENNSTNTNITDDYSYRIAAVDGEGNLCPLTPFDLIDEGTGLCVETKEVDIKDEKNNIIGTHTNQYLKIKLGKGLTINDKGEIELNIDKSSFGFNEKGELVVTDVDGIKASYTQYK